LDLSDPSARRLLQTPRGARGWSQAGPLVGPALDQKLFGLWSTAPSGAWLELQQLTEQGDLGGS